MNGSSGKAQRGQLRVWLFSILAALGICFITAIPASALPTVTTGASASASQHGTVHLFTTPAYATTVSQAKAAGGHVVCPVTSVQAVYKWPKGGGGWAMGEPSNMVGSNGGNGSLAVSYFAYGNYCIKRTFTLSVTPNYRNQGYIVFNPNRGNGRWGMRLLSGRWNPSQGDLSSPGGSIEFLIGSSPMFVLTSNTAGMPQITKGISYGGCSPQKVQLVKTYSHLTLVGLSWQRVGGKFAALNTHALTGDWVSTNSNGVWITSLAWVGSGPTLSATMGFGGTAATVRLNAHTNAVSAPKLGRYGKGYCVAP